MSKKPDKLDQVWSEKELCERLGLPVTDAGRSRVISRWIRDGLEYVELAERRFFFELDVIDFLWGHYETSRPI